jgi:hypothetical protein
MAFHATQTAGKFHALMDIIIVAFCARHLQAFLGQRDAIVEAALLTLSLGLLAQESMLPNLLTHEDQEYLHHAHQLDLIIKLDYAMNLVQIITMEFLLCAGVIAMMDIKNVAWVAQSLRQLAA